MPKNTLINMKQEAQQALQDFILNNKNFFEIDTDPTSAEGDFAPVAAGIATTTPSFDEDSDNTPYYDGQGFGSMDVTGINPSIQFTGHRLFGDKAQDYVAGLVFEVGLQRKTRLRWTQPDGRQIVGSVTISGITPGGGDANAKNTFEFTATFNGKPTLTIPGDDTSVPAVPTNVQATSKTDTSVTLGFNQ